MTEPPSTDLVAPARVDPEVFALRPDYRAAVVTAEGLVPGAADGPGEALLAGAEIAAAAALGDRSVEDLAHVSAWRDAYRAFGAKPQRTRLTADTTSAVFILDALAPISDADLAAAVDDLVAHLLPLGPEVLVRHRVIARDDDPELR